MQSLDQVHQGDRRLDLESLEWNSGIGMLTFQVILSFIKSEGYFPCQWNVNSWQLLPPSFIILLSLVPIKVRSSKKLPPPQDQKRLSLQEKSQAGSARPPSPHLYCSTEREKLRLQNLTSAVCEHYIKRCYRWKMQTTLLKSKRRKCGR